MFYTPPSIFAPPIYRKKPPPAADQPPPPQDLTDGRIPQNTTAYATGGGQAVKRSTDGSPQDSSQRDRLRRLAELGKAGIKTAINGMDQRQVQPDSPPATTTATPRLETGAPNGAGVPDVPASAAIPPSSASPAASQKQENTTGQPPQSPTTTQRATAAPPPSALAAAPAPQGQLLPQTPPSASPAPETTGDDPKVVAALKQAGAQVEAESAVRKQREARRSRLESAGMSGAAGSLDALDDEAEAQRADLEKRYPQRGPEYESGLQALNQHLRQQHAQIAAKAQQLPEIAAKIYQQWGHGVAGNWITGAAPKEGDAYSPGAPLSRTHLDVLDQEAAKYGVDARDLRHHLEMQRLNDWSRASTSYASREQENLVDSTLRSWTGRGPAETARVLPDGSITVNPTLGEDQATFDKAIQGTYSSPEAKEAARKLWPAYHDRWLTDATQTLKNSKRVPGVEDYNEWLTNNQLAGHFSEKLPDGSVRPYTDNEKTQLYLDAMKQRPGWLKLADNLGTSLIAGGGQIIAGGMGLAAMGAGGVEALTGLDVGGQEFSEAAADKALENRALTQSHELTGTTDGFGTRLISSVAQALPSTVVSMVTGGGPARDAILGALQTAGGQYAETYANDIKNGMPHDEAFARSASAAAFSGVMSGFLTRAFPGGTTALNSSAIRSTLSTGANRTALRGSITDAIKAYAATTAHGAQALARGALDEIPQEVLEEGISQLSSAWAEKKDLKQALGEFFAGLPQLVATSGILGAGGEHIAQSHANLQQRQQGTQPAASSPSPQGIPDATTQGEAGSGQQPSTIVNNGQPPSTPPSALPVPTLDQALEARGTADKLKAQEGPLSPDQQQALDAAEKTYARKQEDNILQQQAQIERRGGKLHPTAAKALANAQAVLARRAPQGTADAAVEGGAGNSGQQQPTTANNSKPSQTSFSPVPTLDEAVAAKQTAEKLKAQKGPLSPEQQQAQDATEKTYARKVEDNILNQQAGIERHGGKLHPTTAKALADARAVLARPGPGGSPDGTVNADNTTSYHSNGTDANMTEGGMPGQRSDGQEANSSAAGQPFKTTASNVQPPQTSPLPPPRTPPLSVEQSRRLIENVAQMRPEARQHPQVQADLAQARAVVNESQNKTEAGASAEAPPNVREPEAQGAIPPPGNLPPKPAWLPPHLVAAWDEKLAAARVRDPADHTEILESMENLGPLDRLQVYRAVQSFLDLLPGDITRSLTRFHMRGESAASIKEKVGHEARGAWSPSRVDKVHRGHGVFQEVTVPATILVSHDLNGDETALRTTVWHEMTHWLWDEAGRADAPPRLAQWRRDLEQHFRERTANDQPELHQKGYWYLRDHWIENYSGKISNTEPTGQLLANPPAIELATTYMEKFAHGGLGPAEWSAIKGADSTFEIVMSILGDKK